MADSTRSAWRGDIQALRAIAVLAVVLFHLDAPGCTRGYLGVDVFFVISGYLIGGRLEHMAKTGAGPRALALFWQKRIVRLWPAAVVTMAATALASAWLLDSREWTLFLRQLGGAAALAANIVLWQQTDYFGGTAGTKPLLHFWSLAVEEQFYLLAPFAFILRDKIRRQAIVAILTACSFALWLWLTPRSPSAAFYFLPTRAWELGLGVMAVQLLPSPPAYPDKLCPDAPAASLSFS